MRVCHGRILLFWLYDQTSHLIWSALFQFVMVFLNTMINGHINFGAFVSNRHIKKRNHYSWYPWWCKLLDCANRRTHDTNFHLLQSFIDFGNGDWLDGCCSGCLGRWNINASMGTSCVRDQLWTADRLIDEMVKLWMKTTRNPVSVVYTRYICTPVIVLLTTVLPHNFSGSFMIALFVRLLPSDKVTCTLQPVRFRTSKTWSVGHATSFPWTIISYN